MTITKPIRIQRQRTRGWRMPPNTVYVGRPTGYGNPFEPGKFIPGLTAYKLRLPRLYAPASAAECVSLFRRSLIIEMQESDACLDMVIALRGKNLACWCPVISSDGYVPCHADVLLELANI